MSTKNRFLIVRVKPKVFIIDTETDSVAVGYGSTDQEAERRAWEELRRIEGQLPSESSVMSKERFRVEKEKRYFWGGKKKKVTIYDTETDNVAIGFGSTYEEAEQRAWDKLKRLQGPSRPSEVK